MRQHGEREPERAYDLLVVGGGINGAGIARDAAGRGLRVLLVEQNDLGSGTSSASSKLIHGGLRYLEQYEFRLVREALAEREILLSIAPHIIWPLRFVMPHDAEQRPVWVIRAGLFLYDHLAKRRKLPRSRTLDLSTSPEGEPLKPKFKKGFSYADCWVEDSRLVVLNALDAAERGARIRTHCRFLAARQADGLWEATLRTEGGADETVSARAIVNAAGPWVDRVLRSARNVPGPDRVRLVKGSHIVVRRLYDGDQAYVLQNIDKRIVFVIPYERDYTLVGTTDEAFDLEPGSVAISPEEVAYICAAANRFLREPITPADVVWSYSGVRPLYDDLAASASTITRDYTFSLETGPGGPPILSIFGGKITTYRRLAEHAMEKLALYLPSDAGRAGWTAREALPGGDLPGGDFDAFVRDALGRRPWLPPELARRLARAYGTRADRLLGDARRLSDLGADLGAGLTEREVDYLCEVEWACSAEDVLWRRSKLGLHGGQALADAVEAHLARARHRSGRRACDVGTDRSSTVILSVDDPGSP